MGNHFLASLLRQQRNVQRLQCSLAGAAGWDISLDTATSLAYYT